MGPLEPSTVEEAMQSLLLMIVNALVDDPSSVEIRSEQRDGATCFRLSVNRSEAGKLIGKQGRTARAIRNILSGAGKKHGRRYTVDIRDDESNELPSSDRLGSA